MTIAIPADAQNYNLGLSLLEIIQNVCAELGISQPQQVISSPDLQVKQLLALAAREGREQVSAPGGWPQLRGVQTINLVNGQAAYSLPQDWSSYMPVTIWNPDRRWPVNGPLTAQEWQSIKNGFVNIQPFQRYRLMQGQIFFDPTPSSTDDGSTVVVEYFSNGYCQSADGVVQNAWMADSDVWRLPEDIIILGIKYRFLAAKRLSYAEEKAEYVAAVDREMARAYGGRTLPTNLSDTRYSNFLGDGYSQIVSGDFPGRY